MLDYGCGTGYYSIFLALNGIYVTGIDISDENIKIAKAHARYAGVEDFCCFEEGNCEALEFGNDTFDIVFSAGSLSCLELSKALSELSRVVKRTGMLVILDTLGHNPLLNWNRRIKLKNDLKTEWSVDHILRLDNLCKFGDYFENKEIFFFDLTTLPIAFIEKHFVNRNEYLENYYWPLVTVAKVCDSFLLQLPFLKKYAFKFVCVLSKPYKHN